MGKATDESGLKFKDLQVTISKDLQIIISITIDSDKRLLLVNARYGRKEIGCRQIDYVSDPN